MDNKQNQKQEGERHRHNRFIQADQDEIKRIIIYGTRKERKELLQDRVVFMRWMNDYDYNMEARKRNFYQPRP